LLQARTPACSDRKGLLVSIGRGEGDERNAVAEGWGWVIEMKALWVKSRGVHILFVVAEEGGTGELE